MKGACDLLECAGDPRARTRQLLRELDNGDACQRAPCPGEASPESGGSVGADDDGGLEPQDLTRCERVRAWPRDVLAARPADEITEERAVRSGDEEAGVDEDPNRVLLGDARADLARRSPNRLREPPTGDRLADEQRQLERGALDGRE